MHDTLSVAGSLSDDAVPIERAHRLSYNKAGKPRPVIVKFSRYKDKFKVWESAK